MPRTHDRRTRDDERRRLRRVRDELELSQRELADRFGVAAAAIAQWESGKHTIPGPVMRLVELFESELGLAERVARPARGLPFSWPGRMTRNAAATALWLVFFGALEAGDSPPIVREVRRAALRRFAAMVRDLKGLAMKLGQMTSYADLVLDAPERELLATLHTQLRPMSRADVCRIFIEDLGQTPRQLFAEWSPEPFATASIGQVHAARLHDGRAVAVKVQYPRIADALKIDLAHAALIDRALSLMFRGPQRAVIVDEMRRRFIDECDYVLEAKNQHELARVFTGHGTIRIAGVVDELSTRRILVSELLEGAPLESFSNAANIDARNRAAAAIVDFYSEALHLHGFYNTDPNPGNFLFGDLHTSFLDFGRVQRISPAFAAQLNRVVRAVLERDRAAFRVTLIEMGIVADPAHYDFEHSYRFMLCVHRASLCDEPFTFTTDHLREMWRAFVDRNPNLSRIRLAPEMVFLHQYYFGVTAILVRLGASLSYRAKLLDLLYRDGEQRPSPYTQTELRALDL